MIKVHPNNNDEMEGDILELPWKKLLPGLHDTFHLNETEEITEIKINNNGLRVRIETITD